MLPLVAIGLGLAWFNWGRFGSPLEFGFRYQLTNLDRPHTAFLDWARVRYTLHRYLVGGFQVGLAFPYIQGEINGPLPLPAGFVPTDQLYGLLLTTPVLALALASPFLLGRLIPKPELAALLLPLAASGLPFALLVLTGVGAYRFSADILPPLLLAAAIALQALDRPGWPRLVLAGSWLLLVYSCLLGFLQSCALYGILHAADPQGFSRVARLFDTPVCRAAAVIGHRPMLPMIHCRARAGHMGRSEPLYVSGAPTRQNFVYIYYAGPKQIRSGMEVMGAGGPLSDFLDFDYGSEHTLLLDLGNLYSPPGHPVFAGREQEALAADHRMRLVLDGRTIADVSLQLHPQLGISHWGSSPEDPAFGELFTGPFYRVEFVPMESRFEHPRRP